MDRMNRFCTQCGNPVAPADRFCGRCGHALGDEAPISVPPAEPPGPVTAPAPRPGAAVPPASPTRATGNEAVLGVVPGLSRRKGLLSFEAVNLVVTDRRLILAVMTNQMLRDAAAETARAAKAEGRGIGGRIAQALSGDWMYPHRYETMTPEQILAETAGNEAYPHSNVRSVRVQDGDSEENEPDQLIINLAHGKVVLTARNLRRAELLRLLRQVIPDTR